MSNEDSQHAADYCNRDRRRLVRLAAAAPLLWTAGRWVPAQAAPARASPGSAAPSLERSLSLINTHTGESLLARYCVAGRYVTDVLGRLNHLLRDHRCGEVSAIDPRLFDLLHALAAQGECEPRFEVISGYRSPSSNSYLRSRSSGVARNSLHMQGKAIDVRLCGLRSARLRDLALRLGGGGVGYYGKSDFVHLDTGRVRSWVG